MGNWMEMYAENHRCKSANDYIFYLMFATFCTRCLVRLKILNITWEAGRRCRRAPGRRYSVHNICLEN